MLSPEQEKTYTRDELDLFNLIDQPVWVFDIVKKAMWFANTAAVELWSAISLQDLLERNFSDDMSEATARRLDDYLEKFRQGERLKDQCTYAKKPTETGHHDLFLCLVAMCESQSCLLVQSCSLCKHRDFLSQWTRPENGGNNSLWHPH